MTPDLPPGFEVVDVYWIERGLSLVCIALNEKNHQNEYVLFEPPLTPFEYEILERLYEDLRDVLLLNEEEIRGDKKGSSSPSSKNSSPSTGSPSITRPSSGSSTTSSATSWDGPVSMPS